LKNKRIVQWDPEGNKPHSPNMIKIVETPKWLKVLSSKMEEEILATYAISQFINMVGDG